ncbi:MAG: PIN domain-containing protein [Acidobacteriota bacterium]
MERCFADTNLFLRYLTNDVPEQADAVERLLRQAGSGKVFLETSVLVMAEMIWTMESYYGLDRSAISDNVLAILNTPGLEVENAKLILQAMVWYEEEKVDFGDAYNAAWLLDRGMKVACTFDRKHFARLDGVSVRAPTSQ